jgi:phosphoribosylformylglycinamidine (FGAM) synthase PurS component
MNRESEDIHETALDILSNIVIESYVLSKRMGISYDSLEIQIKEKLRLGIDENNDIEKWYKDLSSLCNHISSNR